MLDLQSTYTATAIKKVIQDFKKLLYTIDISTQIIYLGYLAFALLNGSGVFIANAVLAVLSLAYFVFFLCVTKGGKNVDGNSSKKVVATVFKNAKRIIKLYTLGIAVYGVFTTVSTELNPLSLLLCCFMIVGWVLSLVFDVAIKIIESRFGLVGEAIQADVDNLLKPARSVGNFFKKMTGQEVEPEKEPTKNILMLDKKIEERKEAQQKEKAAILKEQKAQRKKSSGLFAKKQKPEETQTPLTKKEQKAMQKAAKKAEKENKKAMKKTQTEREKLEKKQKRRKSKDGTINTER